MRTLILLLLLGLTASAAHADDAAVTRSGAIAILAKPALPPDFPYFPYVNPNAPKGGEVTLSVVGTFDNFNPFILRGSSAMGLTGSFVILPGGSGSGSTVGHVWESLLTSSADEADAGYGHLAQTIEIPADKMWVAFDLRPEAKFSDGTPVTAEDVAWTYNTLIEKGRPSFKIQMADVKDVEVDGPRRVVFHFKSNENRELPLILGGIAGVAEALLRRARFHQAADRSSHWLRAVSHCEASSWGAASRSSGGRTGGPPTCPPARAPTTSIACGSSISAIRQ